MMHNQKNIKLCRSPVQPDSSTHATLTYLSVLNRIRNRELGVGAVINSARFKLPDLFVETFGPIVYYISSCFRTQQ